MDKLNLYTTPPDYNELNLMAFGTPIVIYNSPLINSLASYQISYPHKLHVVTNLPLEDDPNRARIEYCIFIVSMDSSLSFEFAKQSFSQISLLYQQERSVFVLLNMKDESKYAFPVDELNSFLNNYHIPILYCDPNDAINVQSVAKSIYNLAERVWKRPSSMSNHFLFSDL